MSALLAGCGPRKGNNTEAEMFKAAYEMYQDYLFEYGIDSTLFMPAIIEVRQDSLRSYKWLAVIPNGDTVGVEVIAAKSRVIKPEMILTGNNDAWIFFLGTKDAKMKKSTK